MADFDIVIVGGGIAGASLGAELAPHRRVLVIEAESHCGYHSTGRSAAFWLESYGGAEVARLSAASRPFLAEHGFLRDRGAVTLSQDGWAEVPDGIVTRRLDRAELERILPGLDPRWRHGVLEPGCADIDVGALHAHYLAATRRSGGQIRTEVRMVRARRTAVWTVTLEDGTTITCDLLVNAAGAWADAIAMAADVSPLGIAPKRRTMLQVRVSKSGLRDLPLVADAEGSFYFKGESERSVWLSPHDEIDSEACDSAPEEIDVATAIHRFEQVVDWPIEAVERRWSGLRSFAPDRLPVYGFDVHQPDFLWCVGQGGFGIQTAPAAAKMAAALLLGEPPHVDPAPFLASRFS